MSRSLLSQMWSTGLEGEIVQWDLNSNKIPKIVRLNKVLIFFLLTSLNYCFTFQTLTADFSRFSEPFLHTGTIDMKGKEQSLMYISLPVYPSHITVNLLLLYYLVLNTIITCIKYVYSYFLAPLTLLT